VPRSRGEGRRGEEPLYRAAEEALTHGSILQYADVMASTTRITVTLPTEQVAELRKLTDNVSGYVAEAVARQIRHQLLGDDLRRHQEEHGSFTDEELAQAHAKILGSASSANRTNAA
jgi:post-segregation antitoxin (ccd killing protein)